MREMSLISWNIENFNLLPQKDLEFISSPAFRLGEWDDTDRCLQFYPSTRCHNSDLISIYCKVVPDIILNDEEIPVEFVKLSFEFKGDSKEDVATVWFIEEVRKEKQLSIFKLLRDIYSKRYNLTVLTVSCKSYNYETFCRYFIAQTFVQAEHHFMNFPLSTFNESLTDTFEVTRVIRFRLLSENSSEFKLTCRFQNNILEVDFHRMKGFNNNLLSTIRITGENCGKNIFEGRYLFQCGSSTFTNNSCWSFKSDAHELEGFWKNITAIHFYLTISDGSHVTRLTICREHPEPKTKREPVQYLKKMYAEKEFCDVSFQVGNTKFDAHKCVLGSASPVFASMFKTNMSEKQTGKIEIIDYDEVIVHQMLLFIYSGAIDNLQCDEAVRLYSAADKYQIVELKQLCSDFIINNLSIDSLYDILSIVSLHQDPELKNSVQTFFVSNYKEVVRSADWEDFKEKNLKLAADLMQQVCLRI